MTLSVVTGKPRNGKTLYAVTRIAKKAKDENRQVYYHGIPELTLDWLPLDDPRDWYKADVVPDGAIIVIDESQKTFPPRSTGSKVPDFVQPFDTHGHRGLDVFLITQDPMLIDSFCRNLAGEHLHVHRPFGMQQATVFRWEHVVDPDSDTQRKNAIDRETFRYPKESFDLYKSASLHTVKRKLPWKIAIGLPLLVIGFIASVTIGYKVLHSTKDAAISPASHGGLSVTNTASDKLMPLDVAEYKKLFVPRLPGHPDTAPVYDELAKPALLPVVSACVAMGDNCRCYTQQGTLIKDIDHSYCSDFVVHGEFNHYSPSVLSIAQKQSPIEAKPVEVKKDDKKEDSDKGMNVSAHPDYVQLDDAQKYPPQQAPLYTDDLMGKS